MGKLNDGTLFSLSEPGFLFPGRMFAQVHPSLFKERGRGEF